MSHVFTSRHLLMEYNSKSRSASLRGMICRSWKSWCSFYRTTVNSTFCMYDYFLPIRNSHTDVIQNKHLLFVNKNKVYRFNLRRSIRKLTSSYSNRISTGTEWSVLNFKFLHSREIETRYCERLIQYILLKRVNLPKLNKCLQYFVASLLNICDRYYVFYINKNSFVHTALKFRFDAQMKQDNTVKVKSSCYYN